MGALALIVAAYANFFHNDFHFDDSHAIVENASIRSLANLPRFFTDANTFSSLPQNATYRPLVTLSFATDYAIAHGLAPVPYHVTQLILLLLVAALVAIAAHRVFEAAQPDPRNAWLAIGAATLFAVHTANSETMNFLSCRSELLSAVGFLLAFVIYTRTRRAHLYLIPLAIASLAKAPVVIFAGIVIAWERVIRKKTWREATLAALPSLIAGVIILIALNSMNSPLWTSGGGSRFAYLITQPYVWMHYARLAFLPIGLTADTDLQTFAHLYDTSAIAGYAFLALLCLVAARAAKRRETEPIAFGILWFAITLLPTSSFFPLAEVANEHRLFFPLMGFVIALVWSLHLLGRRWPRLEYAALALLLLAHAAGTHARNNVWKTEETLWRDVTEKSPRNGRAWMNYGLTQMAKGNLREAKDLFDRAAQYTPNYSTLEINRGIVNASLGANDEAERHFRRALELVPDRSSHFYYARWLAARGRAKEAETHLVEAARLGPSWLTPRQLQLDLAIARGDANGARAIAEQMRAIDPSDVSANAILRGEVPGTCASYERCFNDGFAATRAERHVDAAVLYRRAIRFRSTADAWNNLGWSLASIGYNAQAIAAYEETLRLNPAYDRARNNLRILQTSHG
ncbi:MAG TPA: hypothetical protein VFN10_17760 [Thermoanaerobaculia bacterium]|nr:hypothetical protein [Thermoanaerobaculia bacterium]